MIKIFNKDIILSNLFSIIFLIMGGIILTLKIYYYFKFDMLFLDSKALIGMGLLCFGYYTTFMK